MKARTGHICTAACILLAACAKVDVGTDVDGYTIPIFFNASASGTRESKSVFTPDNFNTAGNRIKVYDKYSSDNGEASLYIDGKEAVSDGTEWVLSPTYYWTKTGRHSFIAHSSYNAADDVSAPEVNYDMDSGTLSVPEWTIGPDNQFDLMYSSIHERRMTEANPYRPVPLQMKHLLTSVTFNVKNLISETSIEFNGFSLSGIYHTGSAAIAADGSVTVTLSDNSRTLFSVSGKKETIGYNSTYNIFAGTEAIGADGDILLWPHDNAHFNGIKAEIKYTYYSTSGSDIQETKTINIGTGYVTNNWKAGNRYIYNISIQDNSISFEVKIVSWIISDVILEE